MGLQPEHIQATYLSYLSTIELEKTNPPKGETIRYPDEAEQGSELKGIANLPTLSYTSDVNQKADIVLKKLIGIGGMGEVWQGMQTPLKRMVAVKRLHPKAKNPVTLQRSLLREAWTAGRLEHPNIVPVHCLGLDEEGKPLLVMKRIQGAEWSILLKNDEQLPARYQNRPSLDVHLELLMRVCDAVHFAHSRGVIHRDLKPDNVMVGAFGEVYLLDWGIAVGLDHSELDGIPLAKQVTRPTGTPGYMAPEMAYPELAEIGVHSDVYCLGAILHQVLTGTMRHTGETTQEVLLDTLNTESIRYDLESVPRQLANICNRATALEPSDRYTSVEAFRRDLENYATERDSLALMEQALSSETRLTAAISQENEQVVHELYGAADFGLRRALQLWPSNVEAQQAQHRLYLQMAQFELAREQPAMGLHYLQKFDREQIAADTEIHALRTQLLNLRGELEKRVRLKHNTDLKVFSFRRAIFVTAFILPVAIPPLLRHFFPPQDSLFLATSQMGMCLLVISMIWLSRKWLLQTYINRTLAQFLVWSSIIILFGRFIANTRGISIELISVFEFILFLAMFMYVAILAEKRLVLPYAFIATPCLMYILLGGDAIYLTTAIHNFLCLITMAFIWSRENLRNMNSTT